MVILGTQRLSCVCLSQNQTVTGRASRELEYELSMVLSIPKIMRLTVCNILLNGDEVQKKDCQKVSLQKGRHVMGIFFYDRVYLPFCMTLFHSSISICCKVAFLSTSLPRNIVDNFKVLHFTLSSYSLVTNEVSEYLPQY